jgi:ribosomal-protein-alanine N-acetyltransferase
MDPSYLLKPLTVADLPGLLQLDTLCYGGYWGEQGYRDELNRSNSVVLGIFHRNSLIGFGILWCIEEEGHIISLAVDPDYRRQGLGESLLKALLKTALDRQCAWATLEVRESNLPARCLYEKFGFILLGERKHYYHDTNENALIYWKKPLS